MHNKKEDDCKVQKLILHHKKAGIIYTRKQNDIIHRAAVMCAEVSHSRHSPSSAGVSPLGGVLEEPLLPRSPETGVPRLVSEANTSGCSSVVVTSTPLSASEPHWDLGEGLEVGEVRVSSRVCSSEVF